MENTPLANLPYALYKGDTKIEDGITDDEGRVRITHVKGTPAYRLVFSNGDEFELPVSPAFAKSDKPSDDEAALSNQGLRALDDSTAGRLYE